MVREKEMKLLEFNCSTLPQLEPNYQRKASIWSILTDAESKKKAEALAQLLKKIQDEEE